MNYIIIIFKVLNNIFGNVEILKIKSLSKKNKIENIFQKVFPKH